MTVSPKPNRRTLLTALLALPALSGAETAAAAQNSNRLTGLFSNRNSAAILGQAYLQQRPEEADAQTLEALLLSPANLGVLDPQGISLDGAADQRRLKMALQELRRRDFDEGAVLQIGGCMLSVTELRLCALAALT